MAGSSVRFGMALFGDKELEKALTRLGIETTTKLMKEAAVAAAQPVLDAARDNAPKLSGRLEQNIRIRPVGRKTFAGAMVQTGTRAKMGISGSSKWYYPAHVELGHPKMLFGKGPFGRVEPKPYLRPALYDNKYRALGIMKRVLWTTIRLFVSILRSQQEVAVKGKVKAA